MTLPVTGQTFSDEHSLLLSVDAEHEEAAAFSAHSVAHSEAHSTAGGCTVAASETSVFSVLRQATASPSTPILRRIFFISFSREPAARLYWNSFERPRPSSDRDPGRTYDP